MPQKSDVIIRISGSAESLRNEFRKISKDSEALQNALSRASKVSATAFAGLAGGIGLAVSQAAKFEQIESQFITLTGSVQKANKVIKDLSDFSAKTPFAFEDIAKAGKQLISFGFEASEVRQRLQEIGDVSAATGANLGDLTLIVGQVAAAGKLTGERLLQLQERAVPIGPALAETLGVAESAVKDLVSKGKVDFETFQKAFQSLSAEGGIAFGGLEKQSQTLGGQISTLKDNFVLLTVDLGKQFLPAIKVATAQITKFFQVIRENPELIKTAAYALGIATAFTGLAAVTTGLAAVALKFATVWSAVNTTLGLTPKLAAAAKLAFAGLTKVIRFLAKNPIALLVLAIVSLIVYFREARITAIAVFSGIYTAALKLGDKLSKIFMDIGKLLNSIFTFDKSQIESAFNELASTLKEVGKDLGKAYNEGFDEEVDYQLAQEKLEQSLEKRGETLDQASEDDHDRDSKKLTRREELEQEHKLRMQEIKDQSRDLDLGADLLYKQELAKRELKEKKQRLMEEQEFGKANAKIRAFFRKTDVQNFADTLGTLSTLMRSGNRRLFELGKAAAFARATINIAEGITKAWSRGPILGPIGAAAVGIAGAVQLGSITGAQFNAAQGFSGSGSPFGERFVSTFTPREIVVPERFSEGIKKGEFALTRREDQDSPIGAQQRTTLEISFKGDAAELLEIKKIEDQRSGVFVNG